MSFCLCVLSFVFCEVFAMTDAMNGTTENSKVQSNKFLFVSRDQWQARTPKHIVDLKVPVPYVVIHHTYIPAACYNKEECSIAMTQMQRYHMDVREWCDIGYNFGIGSDGVVYEGRGWRNLGAHSLHFNTISIGICLIGDWRTKLPPAEQLNTTKDLIAAGVEQGFIHPNYKLVGHRQVRATECPGDALFQEIQSWDHYSPFPSCAKDLTHVKELDDNIKKLITEKMASS